MQFHINAANLRFYSILHYHRKFGQAPDAFRSLYIEFLRITSFGAVISLFPFSGTYL